MMNLAFLRALPWRRLRQARARRKASGVALPSWALAEVTLSAAQAQWLLRTVCGWHALSLRDVAPWVGRAVPLVELMTSLAARGVELRACRLADAQSLARGDVLILGDDAAARLFGGPAVAGGGMALVIDAGSHTLRLSPALAPDPLSCRCRDVQGSLVGWVLRSDLQPALRGSRQGWGEDLAIAV
jgi:hypothetical protein